MKQKQKKAKHRSHLETVKGIAHHCDGKEALKLKT